MFVLQCFLFCSWCLIKSRVGTGRLTGTSVAGYTTWTKPSSSTAPLTTKVAQNFPMYFFKLGFTSAAFSVQDEMFCSTEQAAQRGCGVTLPMDVFKKHIYVALRDMVSGHGGDGLVGRLSDLSRLFQPLWFCDSRSLPQTELSETHGVCRSWECAWKKMEVCTITEITESYSPGKGISTLFSKTGFCAICLHAGTYSPASLFSRACKFSKDASASEYTSVPLQILYVLTWALIKHTMFGLEQQEGNLTKLVTAAPRQRNYFSILSWLLLHFPLGIVEE